MAKHTPGLIKQFDGASVSARILGASRQGDPGLSKELLGTLRALHSGERAGGWSLQLENIEFQVTAGAWSVIERDEGPRALELVMGPSIIIVERQGSS